MSNVGDDDLPTFDKPIHPSLVNVFKQESENEATNDEDAKSLQKNDTASNLVNEMLQKYFTEKSGFHEKSSSSCSSPSGKHRSDCKIDNRLLYWKNSLEERRKLGKQIQSETGKKECDILFNKPATIDYRNVQTVKQVMDYAERLNPTTLSVRKKFKLRDTRCQEADLILETLPKSERLQRADSPFEMVGIPSVVKKELGVAGRSCQYKKSSWLKSKELVRRIGATEEDIEGVIEFYPDFEELQVIGSAPACGRAQDTTVNFISEEMLRITSSETSFSENTETSAKGEDDFPLSQPEFALKINDKVYQLPACEEAAPDTIFIEVEFNCEPCERVEKFAFRLENVGRKVLDFEWNRQPEEGARCLHRYLPIDLVFLFDKNAFRIISGEVREIVVVFRPQRIQMRKEKWRLSTDPRFFGKNAAIIVTLRGKCNPSKEYQDAIMKVEQEIESAANLETVLETLNVVIDVTTILPEMKTDLACPYTRLLDDREVFERVNFGFKCCRYHDIEKLKDIYQRIRNVRQDPSQWDMNLQMLKDKILKIENTESRSLIFAEFMGIVQEMQRSASCSLSYEDQENRFREKIQFSKSAFASALDKWEQCVYQLEESLLNQPNDLDLSYDKVLLRNKFKVPQEMRVVRSGEMKESPSGQSFCFAPSAEIRKKRDKNFHDTLYIQTYTQICDLIENIVSVIEGANMM